MTETNRHLEKVNGEWAWVSNVEYDSANLSKNKKKVAPKPKDRSLTDLLGGSFK